MSNEEKLLNTLNSIDSTIKRIEHILKETSTQKDEELVKKLIEDGKKRGKPPLLGI